MGFTNPTIVLLLIASFVALTVYFKRQKQLPTPVLNTSVLRAKAFVQACLIIMVMFMIFNASMTLMPIYIQNIRGLTALQSGLLLLPGGLLMGILGPITGRLFDKIGGKPFAVLGMLLIVVSSLFLSRLDAQSTSLTISFLFSMLMTGNALILTPLTTSAMNALPLSLIPHGSAMNSATRQLFAAIGTAIFVSLMGTKASLEQGFQFAYQAIAGLAFLGLFLALSLPRKH